MKVLLDSHCLLWALDNSEQLGAAASATLQDVDCQLLISVASVWEIAIKVSAGRLPLSLPYREWMDRAIAELDLQILPITLDHAEQQASLPFHHRDPFDRLLAAQALVEELPLVSCDEILDAYGVQRIWN